MGFTRQKVTISGGWDARKGCYESTKMWGVQGVSLLLTASATKANQVWGRRVTLEKAFAQGAYSVGLLSALPTKWTRKAGTRSSQWAESNIQFHL